ncbi:MAG: hypothetical protein Q8K93_28320 [Reyranella sp.]|uniref:DUF1127 domain-containing protein n=1 Tax=Reyranella sp. TaxID=1929291 RepID=UPI0027322376|nr:hypothetical protein [Reyranella sp.]MDP1966097.1 hypothetical protein [Reyranella sp.]MDP2378694.1 hypothetical protein [Reyranella sp.]
MSFQSRDRLIIEQNLFVTPAAVAPPQPSLRQRLVTTIAAWRERTAARRCLAQMDARSLREAGISPAAAAYESGMPFWRKMGELR